METPLTTKPLLNRGFTRYTARNFGLEIDYQKYDPDEGQEAGESERLTLPRVLRAVQQTPLPIPIQDPALLPLHQLDPEVLERLAAEVVSRRDNLGAHFYGRRGQKQHGLDIVEFEVGATCSLYQVKRYETLSGQQMIGIVEEYAGTPRPVGYDGLKRKFDPHRFVVVTSAAVESGSESSGRCSPTGCGCSHSSSASAR
jgi:hypothetical protein